MTAEKRPTSTPTATEERNAFRALLARHGVIVPPSVNGATLRTLWTEKLNDLHVAAIQMDEDRTAFRAEMSHTSSQARIRQFANESFADARARRSEGARKANATRKARALQAATAEVQS